MYTSLRHARTPLLELHWHSRHERVCAWLHRAFEKPYDQDPNWLWSAICRFGVVAVTAEWLIDCALDGRMVDTAQYQPPEPTEQLLDRYPALRAVRCRSQMRAAQPAAFAGPTLSLSRMGDRGWLNQMHVLHSASTLM